ncbi:hypothetical protein OC844_000884 [Tilletia horrida]|nr:hypothetical protein OC844_000884 [Tilletia horrida]
MAPRTQIRQSQALPVNSAQGGGGAGGQGGRAAAAAAARDQNPPWRSSLDLVWSYSRSQAFYGDNIGTSPSFADRRWAGPHRASIAEESDPNLSSHADQEEEDEDDVYSEYEDEYEDEEEEEYVEGYDYEEGEGEEPEEEYEEDDDEDEDEARDAVPSTSLAGLPQPSPARRRGASPRAANQQEYYSSDDEHDHLGRRRSKIPSTRSQVRAVLAQQQAAADSSAVETSSAVSATDMSTTSDAASTGTADVEGGWDGEQLPPNAIQRTDRLPPTTTARRRRRSRNPPSAYRGPRSSMAGTDDGDSGVGLGVGLGAGPHGRGLGRRKRSSDRYSIDSDFSAQRPSRSHHPKQHRAHQATSSGQYGAIESVQSQRQQQGDLELGRPGRSGEGAPLLAPGPRWKGDQAMDASDLRRLSRISSNRTISGFSTAVRTPRFIASQGTSTFLQSWFNTLNALIGVGVLALPLAFALTGPILGPILFLLAGLLTNYTGKVLARIMARNPQLRTYADIGTFAFGPSARWMVTALFCLELWAVSTALIILFGDSVFAVAKLGSPALWKAIGFLIILPTIFLPLKFLSPISVVGIISTITANLEALFFVVLADGLIKKQAPGSLWEPRVDSLVPQWSRLPLSFGLIMSGFSSHPVIPSLFKDMQQPHRFPQMLDRAYIVATIVYLGMGLAGYMMFGSTVTDEITRDLSRIKEYPRVLNNIAIWLIIINPLAKFALAARPITTTAELIFGVEKSQTHIQEALARQMQMQQEDEEAFMAAGANRGAGAGAPRRSSGALSAGGKKTDQQVQRRPSVDIPAIREERRRSNPTQRDGDAGKKDKVGGERGDREEGEEEEHPGLSTPTQAALFGGANPFTTVKDGLADEGKGADKAPAAAGTGKVLSGPTVREPEPLPSVATQSPPLAPLGRSGAGGGGGGRRPSIDHPPSSRPSGASRPSTATNPSVAPVPASDEVLMERALNEVGMDASEINPLAASAFSMRMAKLTARQSAGFKVGARVGVKVAITVLITLTAIVIPGFEKVMAFLGAFLAFASCVFGPLLAHMRIFHTSMPRWRIAADILILALSLVAAALGTVWSFLPR